MGLGGDLFTLFTAPMGSAAYIIAKKNSYDGKVLKDVGKLGKKFIPEWGKFRLDDDTPFWSTQEEAKQFAETHGLNLSEIEIKYTRIVR